MDPERKDQIQTVKNILEKPQKSYRELGKIMAIEICKSKYDPDKLAKLPRKEQFDLIRKHYPTKEIKAQFKLWVVDFLLTVNVKNPLQGHQIDFITDELFREHGWTPEDLYLFFRQVKAGWFGQFYETLSPEKILEWSRAYWHDRCATAEAMNQEKDGQHFNPMVHKMDPEVFKAMFEGVGEEKEEPKILEKKASTFMDSEKGFRAYLRNSAGSMDYEQLVQIISRYRLDSALIGYVEIFTERIEQIKPGDEYKSLVEEWVKLSEAIQGSPSNETLHLHTELGEKLITLEPSKQ